MKSLRGLVAVAFLTGCAEAPPPPATPRPAVQTPSITEVQVQVEKNARLQQEAMVVAQRQQAELVASMQAVSARADADRQAAEARRIDTVRRECAESRAKRAENAKWVVSQRVAFESRVKARSREIIAACKIVRTKTGALNVQKGGSGIRIAPETQDDISCPGGVPKGFTKQEVWVVLARAEQGSPFADGADRVMGSDDHDGADGACGALDREAGLDTDVRYSDGDGIKRLLAWRPDTP